MAHKKKITKEDIKDEKPSDTTKTTKTTKTKQTNKTKPKNNEKYQVPTMTQSEVSQFKEIIQLSNAVAAVKKSMTEKRMRVMQLGMIKQKIKNKEIKPPYLYEVMNGLSATFSDTNKLIKKIDENKIEFEKAANLEEGQLDHRYEEYVAALIQFRNKLNQFIKDTKLHKITPHRAGNVAKQETEIFNKEFDKLVKNETKETKKVAKKME